MYALAEGPPEEGLIQETPSVRLEIANVWSFLDLELVKKATAAPSDAEKELR